MVYLFVLLQELLANENYWFETSADYPVIIDCGTHFGLSLYYFKQLYAHAKIIAFEPNPQLYEMAEMNIALNNWTNIDLMPYAIGSTNGDRRFHIPINGSTMAGSLLKRMNTFGFKLETIDVLSVRLSEIMNGPVDFLKMDIEGAELEVLEDIEDNLSSIQHIFCEFHQGGGVESKDLVTIMKLLDRSGFEVRINVSPNYHSLSEHKPLSSLDQRCSSEIWGTRLKGMT